jgi:hypothetical protein
MLHFLSLTRPSAMTALPISTERPPTSRSAFAWSAAMRVGAVSAIVAALWLAVAWAIGAIG